MSHSRVVSDDVIYIIHQTDDSREDPIFSLDSRESKTSLSSWIINIEGNTKSLYTKLKIRSFGKQNQHLSNTKPFTSIKI